MTATYLPSVDRTSIGSVKDRIEQFDPTKRTKPRNFIQKIDDYFDALPTWVKVSFYVGSFSFLTYMAFNFAAVKYDSCFWDYNYGRDASEFCRVFLSNMNWCKAQDWCQPLAQLIERLN